jgi:hypothetical protein
VRERPLKAKSRPTSILIPHSAGSTKIHLISQTLIPCSSKGDSTTCVEIADTGAWFCGKKNINFQPGEKMFSDLQARHSQKKVYFIAAKHLKPEVFWASQTRTSSASTHRLRLSLDGVRR